MAEAKPITIKMFDGINTLHTRKLIQLSGGKNCIMPTGSLKTRDGYSMITPGAGWGPIKSIHSAVQSGAERLLVEEGSNLWVRPTPTGEWSIIRTGLTGTRLSSCRWEDYLILLNGNEMLSYDITQNTISDLGGVPPSMQYMTEHNHILFGFGPDHFDANKVFICGYVPGTVRRSKDVWNIDELMIDITGNSGAPVMAFIPYSTHYLAVAKDSFWRVYGSTEFDFSNMYGGTTSIVNPRCITKVRDLIMWLGQENGKYKIYTYSGTTPMEISIPIESLFSSYSFSNPWVYSSLNQFMLFLPNLVTGKTTMLVFDVMRKHWQPPHEFNIILNDATEFNLYLQRRYITIGSNAGTIVRLDDSTKDSGSDITTEFTIGPINIDSRKYLIKNIWFVAKPGSNFSFNVYGKADGGAEIGPQEVSFTQGSEKNDNVRFGAFRGQNLSLRCTTTDRIDELQEITIVITPKRVK